MVSHRGFDREWGSLEQKRLTPEEAFRVGLAAEHDSADLLVISSTGYRALEPLPCSSRRPGMPASTIDPGGYLFTRRN